MEQSQGNEKRTIGHLINLLLEEPKIREKIRNDFVKHKRDCDNVLVIVDIARIRFGKYGWSGIGNFANNLFKCYEEISFTDFFIKVWDALVDMTAGTISNTAVIEGLSRETLLRGIKNKEYDWICDRFFDVCRHLTKEGFWNPDGTKANLGNHTYQDPDGIEIQVNARPKSPAMNLRVVDSVGETFEIISARWIGGGR